MSKHKSAILLIIFFAAVISLGGFNDYRKIPKVSSQRLPQIASINWQQALNYIDHGQVSRVYLLPTSRVAVIQTNDGFYQYTEPPTISTYEAVHNCGGVCNNITFSLVRRITIQNACEGCIRMNQS